MIWLWFAIFTSSVGALILVDLSYTAMFGCAFIAVVSYTVWLFLFLTRGKREDGFQNW